MILYGTASDSSFFQCFMKGDYRHLLLWSVTHVESVVKMCARRTGEYEEEVRGPKKEEEPQRQLLDAVFNLQPRIVLRRADVSENIHPELQQSVSGHIKEEEEGEEVQCIKEEEDVFRHMKEEEQEEIIHVPSTGVHLKSKYEGQSEERQGAELPSRNSSCDGDFCERSQTDGHDDEQSEGDLTCHSANQSWKCSQYSKAFATMRNLKRHVKLHTDISENLHPDREQSVSCHIKEEGEDEEVQRIEEEEEEEVVHMKEEEQEEIIQVPVTGVHLKSEDEGQTEERERRAAEPPSRNSSSDGDLCERSQTDRHDDDEQPEGDMTCHTSNKCWKCSHCRKVFTSMRNFNQHMKIHTGEKPFACSVCGQRFTQKGHLNIHTRTHTGEKAFSCSVCGERFTQKGALKGHTRTHTGEKAFSCSVCGKRFTQKGALKGHTRIHTGEKPFSCSDCGQRFTQKGALKEHTRIHTGEKPFFCLVCGQRFTRKGGLKEHTRIHTGEKPFFCSVCGQRFIRKGDMKIHTRIHTGEKPFFCLVCGQRFTRKGHLKIHTRIHTAEKPFSCSVCGQRFTRKVDIKIHTRMHTDEKPFSCSVCGQRFSKRDHLKRHKNTP
ncbi:zinc finger protein 260-like isoform X5 [Syngnathoides biaculeatus]|uniref:zinc finger protein 260-like isoform X5 n=1 Tax=Syngnathoides biaculeatus TaxID=300417 RepID=UPI002ADDAA6A|nr:zinc finger protein 260-like isoform X5 [Syngnathoides biaculeatus]